MEPADPTMPSVKAAGVLRPSGRNYRVGTPLKKATRTEWIVLAVKYLTKPPHSIRHWSSRFLDLLYLSETFCNLLALKREALDFCKRASRKVFGVGQENRVNVRHD